LHDGYPWNLLRQDWPWAEQVVVSRQRQQELAELLGVAPDRIQVIPNGVDAMRFLKLAEETRLLAERLDLLSAAPLVLLPVRITRRKNIELALRVVAELQRANGDSALIVTGPLGAHNPANQRYLDELLQLRAELHLHKAVHFLAEVVDHALADEVIADLYRLSDLLFLPSREEGFGIPLLEAALAGVPIFCSDIQALHEVGGSDVRYFSVDDAPAAIAAQIAAVLKASPEYAMRKRVLRTYAWEQIYEQHIARLLARGG
jgi:glycosyltransferase involved in cell wall biosynthesis